MFKKTLLALTTTLALSATATASNTSFTDTFSGTELGAHWDGIRFEVADGKLFTPRYGTIALNESAIKVTDHYQVSVTAEPGGDRNMNPLIFDFKTSGESFYSARIKKGTWGALSIYHHQSTSHSGDLVYISPKQFNIDSSVSHELKVKIEGDDVFLYLDGEFKHALALSSAHGSNQVGFYGLNANVDEKSDDLMVSNAQTFSTDFHNGVATYIPSTFDATGPWSPVSEGKLITTGPATLLTNDHFLADGDYTAELEWENTLASTQNSPSLIFGYSDENSPYYRAVAENGYLTDIVLYKHNDLADTQGTKITNVAANGGDGGQNTLSARQEGTQVIIYLNGQTVYTHDNSTDNIIGNRAGIRFSGSYEAIDKVEVRSFKMTR